MGSVAIVGMSALYPETMIRAGDGGHLFATAVGRNFGAEEVEEVCCRHLASGSYMPSVSVGSTVPKDGALHRCRNLRRMVAPTSAEAVLENDASDHGYSVMDLAGMGDRRFALEDAVADVVGGIVDMRLDAHLREAAAGKHT